MAITHRSYPIICPSCRGLGYVSNPEFDGHTSTSINMICLACNGYKTVMVNEIIDDSPKGTIEIAKAEPYKET